MSTLKSILALCLFSLLVATSNADIVVVSSNATDPWIDLMDCITDETITVIQPPGASDHTDSGLINTINNASLVIFSRNTNSGDYANSESEVDFWNSVSAPMILSNAFIVREVRWGWQATDGLNNGVNQTTGSETDLTSAGESVFGLTGSQDFFDGAGYSTGTGTFGDGVTLGTASTTGSVSIASWGAGDAFGGTDPDTGLARIAGGDRLFFATPDGSYNFSPAAKAAMTQYLPTVGVATVPEPGSLLLLVTAFGGLLMERRRKQVS